MSPPPYRPEIKVDGGHYFPVSQLNGQKLTLCSEHVLILAIASGTIQP